MARVFLIDDYPLLPGSSYPPLASELGLTVVGAAPSGPALLAQLHATSAQVVLLRLDLAEAEGLATIRELRDEVPHLRVLASASTGSEYTIGQAFEAGAHGYILQDAVKDEWLVAIAAVAAGRLFLCSALGLAMLQKVLAKRASASLPTMLVVSQLTRRENEVLRLLAQGLTTAEMSEKLFTSKRTIETHRQNILEKTQTKNTASLIRQAMLLGLLNDDSSSAAGD
jgi:DNA-binding NarL/FixJ family response regulator